MKIPSEVGSESRQTAQHVLFLDYLRGAAILGVFIFHAFYLVFGFDHLGWNGLFRSFDVTRAFLILLPASFGWVGVPIFFAISGFCIHLSHQRSRVSGYKVFFLRRFFRIYPPYLLTLLFFALVFPESRLHFGFITGHFSWMSIKQLLSHLLLIHNFSNHLIGGINPPYWSIAVEAQLYLIYPLLLWFATRLGWRRVLWITGLTELGVKGIEGVMAIYQPHFQLSQIYAGSPFYFWFDWAVGALLADAYLKREALPFCSSYLGVFWPFFFLGCYFFKPLSFFCNPAAALASAHLMAYFLSHPPVEKISVGRMTHFLEHLRWAGIVSYSAYLIHYPCLQLVSALVHLVSHHVLPPLVMFGIYLVAWGPVFGLSYGFYQLVEKPSIDWGKKVIERSFGSAKLRLG